MKTQDLFHKGRKVMVLMKGFPIGTITNGEWVDAPGGLDTPHTHVTYTDVQGVTRGVWCNVCDMVPENMTDAEIVAHDGRTA